MPPGTCSVGIEAIEQVPGDVDVHYHEKGDAEAEQHDTAEHAAVGQRQRRDLHVAEQRGERQRHADRDGYDPDRAVFPKFAAHQPGVVVHGAPLDSLATNKSDTLGVSSSPRFASSCTSSVSDLFVAKLS